MGSVTANFIKVRMTERSVYLQNTLYKFLESPQHCTNPTTFFPKNFPTMKANKKKKERKERRVSLVSYTHTQAHNDVRFSRIFSIPCLFS